MRSLTLARALRSAGAEITFISRRHAGNLIDLVQGEGISILSLPEPETNLAGPTEPPHASWVGASWQEDARATRAILSELPGVPDWLIVDHYGLDARWEAEVRADAKHILAIDDLADRDHDCDMLLDQNLVEGMTERYRRRVGDECPTMLGPRYALLQPEYERLHKQVAPRGGAVQRVLIYFGSTDPCNLAELALHAFSTLNPPGIEVDLVAGENASRLRALARPHAQVRVHGQLASLAPLIAAADLALGAAGSTSWERMCLGLPALVITLADNQREVARALHQRGLVRWIGHVDEVGEPALRAALAAQIALGADTASSREGLAIVDGQGVRRVATAVLLDASTPLVIRNSRAADEKLLLELANDPVTRRYSFGRPIVGEQEHHSWFCARLKQAQNCLLLIAETDDGVPLGTVRFDRGGERWRVNYSVAAPYRGRGVGRRMLALALQELAQRREARCVFGQAMVTNVASHKLFRDLGFEVIKDSDGVVEYQRSL
jgi:UDP-2,4-diacetamido-2,4,6-trideoxy-beta-L-altropyranose hydrolase